MHIKFKPFSDRYILLIIILLSQVLFSCSLKAPEKQIASGFPQWCINPPDSLDNRFFFVGMAQKAANLPQGKALAMDDARAQVSRFIGTEVNTDWSQTMIREKGGFGIEKSTVVKSMNRSVSKHLVQRLQVERTFVLPTDETGLTSLCILSSITQDKIDQAVEETKKRAQLAQQQDLQELETYLVKSSTFVMQKKPLEALALLLKAKQKYNNRPSAGFNFATLEVKILEVLSEIKLTEISPQIQMGGRSYHRNKISVQVSFREKSLANFPLLISGSNKATEVTTDKNGAAGLLHQGTFKGKELQYRVEIDRQKLLGKDSYPKGNSGAVIFTIQKNLDPVGGHLNQDFGLQLQTASRSLSFNKNEVFKVNYSCLKTRCYLKLFAYEDQGPVVVLKDSKDQRLMVKEVRTIRLLGDSAPNTTTVYILASTKPFAKNFKANQQLPREDFTKMTEAMKSTGAKISEKKIQITIEGK